MAGSGAGPSRRSHTKSRKGCKTCKKRHIRCDETFPQCRNCTKHQVRCDYMESVGSDTESQSQQSPEPHPLSFSPTTESRIDQWKESGAFPYPDLHVFPALPTLEYSKNELRLIHHLSSVANDLQQRGQSDLTVWTDKLAHFLSLASTHPYVMRALLSFSASNLAWSHASPDTRNLHIHYGTVALRGLHDAIGSFSHANADAVLAASILLLWQATDYRSWSSLRAGIQSVVASMQPWKHESIFADFVLAEDLSGSGPPRRRSSTPLERAALLSTIALSLQRLHTVLAPHDVEAYWVAQLLSYVERLQACTPAADADEQFSHLYLLRKWLLWVPTALLQQQGGGGPALLTVAHFYGVALALEPLFPALGASFCARASLAPLERILRLTDAMQSRHGHDQASLEIASLMQFPQQAVATFRARSSAVGLGVFGAADATTPSFLPFDASTFDFSSGSDLSPSFSPAAAAASYAGPTSAPTPTGFLHVPGGFTAGTQAWGAAPSPGFPPQAFSAADSDALYDFEPPPHSGFHHPAGFVLSPPPPPPAIWT